MTSTPDDGSAAGDGPPPDPPAEDRPGPPDDVTRLDPGRVRRDRGRPDRGRADEGATSLDPGRLPRREGPGDGAGPRDDGTRLDPGRPRRGGPRDRGGPEGGRLPPALAGRFALINEVQGTAGEAALYVVREHGDHRLRVLKLYQDGRVPDAEVWAWLRGERDTRPGEHIAGVLETGLVDGRAYEVMEHLAGNDLGWMLRNAPQSLDPATLEVIVGQLAQALSQMHDAGIVHCDVKPANVVVRSLDPLDVALADFGVARFVGRSVSTFTGAGGERFAPDQLLTFRYAAPEWLIARSLGPPADWWSLGMTVAELSGRRHPFVTWPDEVILKLFANTRPVDLSAVANPRLRLLCRGLLLRDDAARWGQREVSDWLSGRPPEVTDDYPADGAPAPAPSREAFLYRETSYTDPRDLAIALMADWEAAASQFFPPRSGDAKPWRRLCRWLRTLDGPEHEEPGRSELIRALGRRQLPADVRLYQLLRWLYPEGRPVYRRAEITSAELPGLARAGAGAVATGAQGLGEGAVRDIVGDLWRERLLPELAQAPGGTGLADADRRWRQWHEHWLELSGRVGRQRRIGQLLSRVPPVTVLSYLLWLAAEEETARAWLTRQAARSRAGLVLDLPWFSQLTGRNASVLSLLCAVLLSGDAEREAREIMQEREAERIRRQRLLEGQAVAAWFRRHDRPTALGWAAGATALVVIFWAGVITVCDILPFASTASIELAWACVILAVMILAAAELGLAGVIGGPYHPLYSLLGDGISWAADTVRTVRERGLLFIGILAAALAVVLAATSYLPFLLPLATAAGELAWCGARYRRWRADEEERESDIRLAARERRAGQAGRGAARGPAA